MATLAKQQQGIVQDLLRLLVALFPSLEPERITDTWPGLLMALVNEVDAAHTAAGQAAVGVYMDARKAAGTNTPPFRPALAQLDEDGLKRLRASLTITGPVALMRALRRGETPGMARKLALVQLQGTATRYALAGARDTTVNAVAADPVALGWARVPRPDACPFCLMLGTRAVGGEDDRTLYHSKESAGRTGGRSKRGADQAYHDHCRCEVVGVFTPDWSPPDHVLAAEELWKTSTAGKSGAKARKAFADAVNAQRAAEQEKTAEPERDRVETTHRPEPEPAPLVPVGDLDDDQLDTAMQDALGAEDWDRFEELSAEADRRDQERRAAEAEQAAKQARREADQQRREDRRVAQEEERAAEYERLLEQGYGEEEAVSQAYGITVEQQRRESAILSLRDQGYRGSSFDDLARQSYKDKLASDYWAAEDATNGYLLSREGENKGIDPRDLWTNNEQFARRWASAELREWWDRNGRVTFAEWKAQLLGDVAAAGRAQAQRGDFLA